MAKTCSECFSDSYSPIKIQFYKTFVFIAFLIFFEIYFFHQFYYFFMIFIPFSAIIHCFHNYFATWSQYFATWDLFRASGALPDGRIQCMVDFVNVLLIFQMSFDMVIDQTVGARPPPQKSDEKGKVVKK